MPGPVEETARLAGAVRRARPLHTAGRSFAAEVEVTPDPPRPWRVGLLDTPGRYAATARLSKGASTPPGWPDVLGLAIRVAHPDGPVDLLMSTTARPPLIRHVPLPRRDFAAFYGTLLAYRSPGGPLHLGALPDPASATPVGRTLDRVASGAEHGPLRFLLVAARPAAWRPYGRLSFGTPLFATADAALAFDHTTRHPDDLVPAGWLDRLRGAVYRGAQRGRLGLAH